MFSIRRFSFIIVLVIFVHAVVGVPTPTAAQTPSCVIQTFTANPASSAQEGEFVTFIREVKCKDGIGLRASRITLNGDPECEESTFQATCTLSTLEQLKPGKYHICAQVSPVGDNNWADIDEQCIDFVVHPRQQLPNPPSCQITQMTPSYNIVVRQNTPQEISASAECSTGVRAMRISVEPGSMEVKGSSISWTFPGFASSDTLWAVCVQAAGEGDDNWDYAAEKCITIQVEDSQHPYQELKPPSKSDETPPSSGVKFCPNAPDSFMAGYSQGKFTEAAAGQGFYAQPGSGVALPITPGKTFYLVDGPKCVGNQVWWEVESGRDLGWVAEGEGTTLYLEHIGPFDPTAPGASEVTKNNSEGGNSEGNSNQSHDDINSENSSVGGIEEIIVVLDDGPSIAIEYNPSNREIQNGNEFIAWEINRLLTRMQQPVCPSNALQYEECNLAQAGKMFTDAVTYNMELWGEVEIIRHAIEDKICNIDSNCSNAKEFGQTVRYLVGDGKKMDTSGPGNVVFGYICSWMKIPIIIEDPFSDVTQILSSALREYKSQLTDYPDDKEQRRMGRRIYILANNYPNSSYVEEAAIGSGNLDNLTPSSW